MHVHASAHAPAKRFQPACWSSSQQAAWVAWVPCRPPPPHTHTRNTLQSRRDDDTSHAGRHRAPVWNQDFQFLVEDPATQVRGGGQPLRLEGSWLIMPLPYVDNQFSASPSSRPPRPLRALSHTCVFPPTPHPTPPPQTLDIWIGDSPMTGRTEVGTASFPLQELAADGTADVWLPVESSMPGGWPFRGGRGGC
jgi:hypothetical protein